MNYELYVMNADGSNPVRLTNSTGWDYAPDWSPNGSQILFQSQRDGNWELYKMNADGSNQVPLTSNSSNDTSARWSSDGTKIVFETNRNGMNQIFTMNADGSNQNAITDTGGRVYSPSWQSVGEFCATDESDSATPLKTQLEQVFAATSYVASAPGTVQIPIHFHVITESTDNKPLEQEVGYIPESKLVEQLNVMNSAFSGVTGGVNTPFRFHIADITYSENTAWFIAGPNSEQEYEMARALYRGSARHMNLYIKNSPTSSGYAIRADQYAANLVYDRVVIRYTTLPGGSQTNFNNGNVAVHEAGHWLGLFHTFLTVHIPRDVCYTESYNDPNSPDYCEKVGDRVCDTAQHLIPKSRISCVQTDTCPRLPGADPVLNYMNYTLSTCWNQFTAGQSRRMDIQTQMHRPDDTP